MAYFKQQLEEAKRINRYKDVDDEAKSEVNTNRENIEDISIGSISEN
jgi:hypothetical protein